MEQIQLLIRRYLDLRLKQNKPKTVRECSVLGHARSALAAIYLHQVIIIDFSFQINFIFLPMKSYLTFDLASFYLSSFDRVVSMMHSPKLSTL
jgi:hypothetical protein